MNLKLKMTLETDAIFGNGESIPGGEDIAVLTDSKGFPYYKAGTFKGIFREELENMIAWGAVKKEVLEKMGDAGDDDVIKSKLRFFDFTISEKVKSRVSESAETPQDVLDAFTYLRTFTAINEKSGVAKKGTLRLARCIKEGITFYSNIECEEEDIPWIEGVLGVIKWIGTMRNRGFGKVRLEAIRQGGDI